MRFQVHDMLKTFLHSRTGGAQESCFPSKPCLTKSQFPIRPGIFVVRFVSDAFFLTFRRITSISRPVLLVVSNCPATSSSVIMPGLFMAAMSIHSFQVSLIHRQQSANHASTVFWTPSSFVPHLHDIRKATQGLGGLCAPLCFRYSFQPLDFLGTSPSSLP